MNDSNSRAFRATDDTCGGLLTMIRGTGPTVIVSTSGARVCLDLDDGLALLSFLADALGVERYIPEVTS